MESANTFEKAQAAWDALEAAAKRADYLDSVDWSTQEDRDEAAKEYKAAETAYEAIYKEFNAQALQASAMWTYQENLNTTAAREYQEVVDAWKVKNPGKTALDYLLAQI